MNQFVYAGRSQMDCSIAFLASNDGDGNRIFKQAGGNAYYLVDDRNPSSYPQVVEEYQRIKLGYQWVILLDRVTITGWIDQPATV